MKNKIIALVIWFVTLFVPTKAWIFNEVEVGFMYLLMFVLTLVGIGAGSYFFSRTTNEVA